MGRYSSLLSRTLLEKIKQREEKEDLINLEKSARKVFLLFDTLIRIITFHFVQVKGKKKDYRELSDREFFKRVDEGKEIDELFVCLTQHIRGHKLIFVPGYCC